MISAFVDSDVLLDSILERKPFSSESSKLLHLAELKEIYLGTSSDSFTNMFYVFKRISSKEEAKNALRKLISIVGVLNVDENIVLKAIESGYDDFEDAVQYYCAAEHKMEYIITRNIKDYKLSELPVLTPTDFLAII